MFTPKVKFSLIPIQLEVNLIYFFLFYDKWGWGKKIIKRHSSLKNVLSIKAKENRENYIKKYIIKFRIDNKKIIENKLIKKYSKNWGKIEKQYLTILPEILNISWPKDKKIIKAMISINPINPRFLDNWSFSIFYKCNSKHAKEIILHECCHFLYFEKWKKLHPKSNKKTFESPYIEWHLSELVTPIILNDKRIQKYLKQKVGFYNEHLKIKIGNKTAPEFFTELYKEHVKKENGFEIFLEEAYKKIKQKRKLFF